MKIIIKSLVIALVLTACSKDSDPDPNPTPANQNIDVEVATTLIGKGNLFGNGAENISPQNLVIDNDADWNLLKSRMDTTNPSTAEFTETEIDFNQWTVLAAFDVIRGNGGHSIDIVEVFESQSLITAFVEKSLTGDLTAVVTQPFHIVKIPATNKPIVFE